MKNAWQWFLLALALRVAFALYLGDGMVQVDEVGRFAAMHLGSPLLPRLLQACVSAATAAMIGAMTANLTGYNRAGMIALVISAIYPFFIYYSGVLMTETLYLALIVPGLWSLCEGDSPWAGICLGLAAWVRPEAMYVTGILWPFCRGRLLALAFWALTLGFVHVFAGQDHHGGITFLHGTLLFDIDQREGTGKAMEVLKRMPEYKRVEHLSAAEQDSAFRWLAVDYMVADPARMLRQWIRKTVNFWRFWPRTDKPLSTHAGTHPDAGLPSWGLVVLSLCFEPWLIIFGGIGLWFMVLERRNVLPLLLFVLGTWSVHAAVVSQMRYRLPAMPFLIIGFAYLLEEVFRVGQWRDAARLGRWT